MVGLSQEFDIFCEQKYAPKTSTPYWRQLIDRKIHASNLHRPISVKMPETSHEVGFEWIQQLRPGQQLHTGFSGFPSFDHDGSRESGECRGKTNHFSYKTLALQLQSKLSQAAFHGPHTLGFTAYNPKKADLISDEHLSPLPAPSIGYAPRDRPRVGNPEDDGALSLEHIFLYP